jgi:Flp pilus assembly protein TadD
MSRRDISGAEAAFVKASQVDPRLVDPHVRLAELYLAGGKYDEAVGHALATLEVDPANASAMMVAGTAYQQTGDAAKAREQYQTLLKLNPKNAGAANNLAVLLCEQMKDLDGALMYARLAQQLAPGDPHVDDTLGWILFQRRSFDEAAKLLRSSAERLPDSPTVLYHLGMLSQQLGDVASARQALTKAVSSPANFSGKDDARRALAQLK